MKRTIQGLLFTAILIVGCASSNIESRPLSPEKASRATSAKLADIEERLAGICKAMNKYGLPRRPDTRKYLREKVGELGAVAMAEPDAQSMAGNTARESLETFAGTYLGCDPVIAREINEQLELVDPA